MVESEKMLKQRNYVFFLRIDALEWLKSKKINGDPKSYPALKMKKGKTASSQTNFKAAKSRCRKKLMHQSCSLYSWE